MLRLWRSSSVRLALGYAGLFVVSSLLLVGLLWWGTAGYLDRESTAVIQTDANAIKDDLAYRGLAGVTETVTERAASVIDGHAVYLLADPVLKRLAGNIPAWPSEIKPKPGWYETSVFLAGRFRTMKIEEVSLPNGYHLLVGRDIQDRAEVRALIVKGLSWAAIGALVIAIAGGLLVRRAVLRRVDAINTAASAIVHGDLSQRLPTNRTTDEFDQLAQTINLMLGQIEHLIEGIRNTSNAVAHDLRTPLAELRAELEELTRAHKPRGAMLDGVHKAVADIDRLIGIFNALLRLAEIDSGLRRSGFRRVELSKLAVEVAELYGPLAEEKHASFILEADGTSIVYGDPYLLAQALGNLVDNAVKYAPCHGAISLRVGRDDAGHTGVSVADNGPGIPEAEKPRVTARFYRCRGDHKPEGIGLGLSVVDAVARLHGGELSLHDNHPGLIARLRLPAEEPSLGMVGPTFGASAIEGMQCDEL
jgi:signal transduction histidine kinase